MSINNIKHLELLNNKEYTYVFTTEYKEDINVNDLSIFECTEWEHLINLSVKFEQAVYNLRDLSENDWDNIDDKVKTASYFFYYSPYTMYSGLSNLEYNNGNKVEIYEKIYNIIKDGKNNITINKFREWIINNYDNIKINYNLIIN